jgi:integrase
MDEWKHDREAAMLRGKSRNHSHGSQGNTRRISVYIGCDFQELGILSPPDMKERDFHDWIEGMRAGSFRGSSLSSQTIRKRVETLRAMLRAGCRDEQLAFVELWRPDRHEKDIHYWSLEELDCMDDTALAMFENVKHRPRAMAHLIHSMTAPRISDTASFRWESFDVQREQMRFRASKNNKVCFQYLQPRFIPYIMRYREWVEQFPGGDVYLFPSSMAQRSGTTKRRLPHISDKSIRKWLAQVRDSSELPDGSKPQNLPSHSYRHSLAMRYLSAGNTFENIAMVLGDETATIEKHYAELSPNQAQERAFHRAFTQSTVITSEGTVQPAWLKRRRGSNPARVVDAGVCRPQINTSLLSGQLML